MIIKEQMKYHYLLEDFFVTIIEAVPINSCICFYELHTHEKNYLFELKDFLIYDNKKVYESLTFGIPEAIVLLNTESKNILIGFMRKDSLLSDLIHFSIFYNEKLLIESYDNLKNTAINKNLLTNRIKWKRFYSEHLIIEV